MNLCLAIMITTMEINVKVARMDFILIHRKLNAWVRFLKRTMSIEHECISFLTFQVVDVISQARLKIHFVTKAMDNAIARTTWRAENVTLA